MSFFRKTRFLVLLLALGLSACEEAGEAGIALSDAWTRATPDGARTGAVYLTLQNGGPSADQLLGAASPQAERAVLHGMQMDGDVMRMRKIEALALPVGEAVSLAPVGRHIMLMGLGAPLKEGATLTLRLRFAQAPAMEIAVPVLALGAAGPSAMRPGATDAGAMDTGAMEHGEEGGH